jgi:glutathione S-transferase
VAFRFQTFRVAISAPAGDYLRLLMALPGMRAWEAAALLEPWREAGHEEDALRTGETAADLRTAHPGT